MSNAIVNSHPWENLIRKGCSKENLSPFPSTSSREDNVKKEPNSVRESQSSLVEETNIPTGKDGSSNLLLLANPTLDHRGRTSNNETSSINILSDHQLNIDQSTTNTNSSSSLSPVENTIYRKEAFTFIEPIALEPPLDLRDLEALVDLGFEGLIAAVEDQSMANQND